MDLTRLQQRLQPKPDGESAVRHRTGTVNTVNSDGTVDLDLGGVVVPDVSVLDGAFIEAGDVVQVVAWAGDLLVLGRGATSDGGGPLGFLGWQTTTTNQTGISAVTDITGGAVTVTVAATRRLRVTGSVRVIQRTGAGIAFAEIREGSTSMGRIGVHTLQANEIDLFQGAAIIVNPSAGSHTYKLSVATNANTLDTQDGAAFPHWIMVEDLGPV